jgi:hypothetical protein
MALDPLVQAKAQIIAVLGDIASFLRAIDWDTDGTAADAANHAHALDGLCEIGLDQLLLLASHQGAQQKEDQGAALLPVLPSAAASTETLPNSEERHQ